jgi:hypothetical protein
MLNVECFRAGFRFPIDRAPMNGMMAGRRRKMGGMETTPFCRPEFKTDSKQYL